MNPSLENPPTLADPESPSGNCVSLPTDLQSLTPVPDNPTPARKNGKTVRPSRKRRGKIARLPKHIREELNTRLEDGQSHDDILLWLHQNGQSGFNKQNLTNWHYGGYEDWKRENQRIDNQAMQREWLAEQFADSQPGELFTFIDQLFVSQLMDSLFGLDTAEMKTALGRNPRHFVALFNAFNRFKRQATDSPSSRPFCANRRKGRSLANAASAVEPGGRSKQCSTSHDDPEPTQSRCGGCEAAVGLNDDDSQPPQNPHPVKVSQG
jgi:hypothetical protein